MVIHRAASRRERAFQLIDQRAHIRHRSADRFRRIQVDPRHLQQLQWLHRAAGLQHLQPALHRGAPSSSTRSAIAVAATKPTEYVWGYSPMQ